MSSGTSWGLGGGGMGRHLSNQGICSAAPTGDCYLLLVLQITFLSEWEVGGYHSSEFSILFFKQLSVSIM